MYIWNTHLVWAWHGNHRSLKMQKEWGWKWAWALGRWVGRGQNRSEESFINQRWTSKRCTILSSTVSELTPLNEHLGDRMSWEWAMWPEGQVEAPFPTSEPSPPPQAFEFSKQRKHSNGLHAMITYTFLFQIQQLFPHATQMIPIFEKMESSPRTFVTSSSAVLASGVSKHHNWKSAGCFMRLCFDFMCVDVALHTCLMPRKTNQKRELITLELEYQTVVSYHVGAGN